MPTSDDLVGAITWSVALKIYPSTLTTIASDPVYARAVAASILAQMPITAKTVMDGAAEVLWEKRTPADNHPWQQRIESYAPKNLEFVTLSLIEPDASSWPRGLLRADPRQPNTLAFGMPVGMSPQASESLRKLAEERDRALEKRAHLNQQPSAEDTTSIATQAAELLSNFEEVIPSTLFGIKFGRELIEAHEAPLPPTDLLGLYAEIRSGPAHDLKLSYDEVLKDPQTVNGQSLYFSWTRFNMSYSFSWGTSCRPLFSLCRFVLAPKATYWTLDANLPLLAGGNGYAVAEHFATDRAISAGLYAGIPLFLTNWIYNFWLEDDFGFPALGSNKSAVSAQRFGVDMYYKWRAFFDEKDSRFIGILLFAQREDINFAIKNSQASEAGNVSVGSTYGGGGISFAW